MLQFWKRPSPGPYGAERERGRQRTYHTTISVSIKAACLGKRLLREVSWLGAREGVTHLLPL